jgi:hypothetical protein
MAGGGENVSVGMNPYRLFFTSFDSNEPPHVQVEREDSTCKFWLGPLELARNHGFTARELNAMGARQKVETSQVRRAAFTPGAPAV